jgi:hypothetical protein
MISSCGDTSNPAVCLSLSLVFFRAGVASGSLFRLHCSQRFSAVEQHHDELARLVVLGTQFSDHVLLRMEQRDFNEADLRMMLEDASKVIPDADPARWIVLTQFRGVAWRIVLEPDRASTIIVVITAFEVF